MKRFIICAAIHYINNNVYSNQPKNISKGIVICGLRHINCRYIASKVFAYLPLYKKEELQNTCINGFLTNDNYFVDRKEAYKIAFEADQIIGPNKGCAENEIGLTSEDLY